MTSLPPHPPTTAGTTLGQNLHQATMTNRAMNLQKQVLPATVNAHHRRYRRRSPTPRLKIALSGILSMIFARKTQSR
jgi:hypothetical protein